MAMNLRLSPAAEEALDRLAVGAPSRTAAIEAAIVEKDARTSQADRARAHVARIIVRDADILAALADR